MGPVPALKKVCQERLDRVAAWAECSRPMADTLLLQAVHLSMALFFIGVVIGFLSPQSFCCVEPAARVLPVLVEPAVIKRSLLISQEHPGQPSLLSGWKSWGWSLVSKDQVCPWEAGSIGGFTLGLLGGFGRAALLVQISHPWIGRNEICLCVSAQ